MILKIRPLITLQTTLENIPRRWLELVEPKIKRVGECWLWQGACDSDGEPVVNYLNLETMKRNTRRVKRIVGELFWELKRHHDLLHTCGDLTCVNPSHLAPSTEHWTARK